MINDPIVSEVRKIRDSLAAECDYNLHTYFEMLRKEDSKLARKESKATSSRSKRDKSEQSAPAAARASRR